MTATPPLGGDGLDLDVGEVARREEIPHRVRRLDLRQRLARAVVTSRATSAGSTIPSQRNATETTGCPSRLGAAASSARRIRPDEAETEDESEASAAHRAEPLRPRPSPQVDEVDVVLVVAQTQDPGLRDPTLDLDDRLAAAGLEERLRVGDGPVGEICLSDGGRRARRGRST